MKRPAAASPEVTPVSKRPAGAEEAAQGPRRVIDTHIHLASRWQEGAGGLSNPWLRGNAQGVAVGKGFNREWDERAFREAVASSGAVDVTQAVFVECFNQPVEAEAKWVLDMVNDPKSIVTGVVAHVPVTDGAEAVDAFLGPLRDSAGSLPRGLKGARCVFLGSPPPAADACLESKFLEGLEALQRARLHWEFACNPCALPSVTKVCQKFPSLTFVLDHIGHNDGGEDFETWAPALVEVAKNKNVFCKLGAIEEWGVKDPLPYLEHGLKSFGYDRCLYESNWFVSEAFGDTYDKTFLLVQAAMQRLGATEEEQEQVFVSNALKVYRLEP